MLPSVKLHIGKVYARGRAVNRKTQSLGKIRLQEPFGMSSEARFHSFSARGQRSNELNIEAW